MSEKTKEVKKWIYNVYLKFAWWNYLVFMSNYIYFQSMSIGCDGKMEHLFGFLRRYLLIIALYWNGDKLGILINICYLNYMN